MEQFRRKLKVQELEAESRQWAIIRWSSGHAHRQANSNYSPRTGAKCLQVTTFLHLLVYSNQRCVTRTFSIKNVHRLVM
jgi:hypothetical protein